MKTTQKETQTDQPPTINDVFNSWLSGLTVGEYKTTIYLLKDKLGWSDQVLSQKRNGGSAIKLAEQLAIETLTGALIF